jgi:hypothetical protein
MGENIFKKADTPLNALSLGAGVQSSTLALMAARGLINPMPDIAIFADTQAEPASVYNYLDWLEKELPYPVERVTAGSLTESILEMKITKDGRKFSKTSLPAFTRNVDGSQGKITHRSCTVDFKIKPILKFLRKWAEIKRGQKLISVTQWIGISWDELTRVKEARDPWVQNRWPLLELRMTRKDCLDWMEGNGYPPPPRSSCVYCPFHNNKEWRRLRDEEPEEFQRAADFEKDFQEIKNTSDNFNSVPFLHRSLVPLQKVDLSTDTERGQTLLDGFNNECEGMCGL